MESPRRFAANVAVLLISLAYGSMPVLVAQGNPFIGTWRLNLEKSMFDPGPGPMSSTTRIEAAGNGVKYTVDQVNAAGEKQHWEFTVSYDGKDAKIVGRNPNGDTVAATRVDARTVRLVYKQAGKQTITQVSEVAPNWKTRTITSTGNVPAGFSVNNKTFYERQ